MQLLTLLNDSIRKTIVEITNEIHKEFVVMLDELKKEAIRAKAAETELKAKLNTLSNFLFKKPL
jgi:DNA-binding protein H-NS